jgi:hypothetical protein
VARTRSAGTHAGHRGGAGWSTADPGQMGGAEDLLLGGSYDMLEEAGTQGQSVREDGWCFQRRRRSPGAAAAWRSPGAAAAWRSPGADGCAVNLAQQGKMGSRRGGEVVR